MKYLLLIILLPMVVFGQLRDPTVEFRNFSGGLNTMMFELQPNQGTRFFNIDLSVKYGTLTKRKGYTVLTDTLPQATPIYGLYGATDRDGSKRLFAITDQQSTSLTGLGYLVASPDYSYIIDIDSGADSLYPYIYTGVTGFWTTWKDDKFFSNGRQVPIVVHDEFARDLVVQAPGEPRIYPMNVDAPDFEIGGNTYTEGLNGEYRYLIRIRTWCGSGDSILAIPDSMFETWTDDSNLTEWYFNDGSGDYALSRNSDSALQGTYCAKIQSLSGTTNDAYLADTVTCTNSKNYTITTYVNQEYYTAPPGDFMMNIIGLPDGDTLLNAYQSGVGRGWYSFADNFTTTDSTNSMRIEIGYSVNLVSCSTIIYIDSMVIEADPPTPLYDSYLSHTVKAYNETILLSNFLFHTEMYGCDTNDVNWDDINVELFRCRANSGEINDLDTFWRIANYGGLSNAELDTLRIIDSVPDAALGTAPLDQFKTYDIAKRGRNVDTTISGFRVGAPTYISRNINSEDVCLLLEGDTAVDSHLVCVAYAMTYLDTITGYESDTGRNLYVFLETDTFSTDSFNFQDTNFTIGIPPLPAGRNHLVRRLWKAMGTKHPYDTVYGGTILGYDTIPHVSNVGYSGSGGDDMHWYPGGPTAWDNANYQYFTVVYNDDGTYFYRYFAVDSMEVPIYSNDTSFNNYYLVATIRDSSIKQVIDTASWSNTSFGEQYRYNIAPTSLTGIVPFGDRAWGYMDSRVYFSRLDSSGYWWPFGDFAVNLDDGDAITSVMPFRDHIKIFKNEAQFILYQNDAGDYTKKWVIDDIGCIAPHSMVNYNNGLVYFSKHGITYETGLIYKDKGSSFGIISRQIENLLDYTPAEHRTAVGAIKDNKYWLSYPAKDTTYIYDFKTQAWTIYSYAFAQVTFYDTVHAPNIQPANDMLFIKDDDDRVFKADTGYSDNGVTYDMIWKSGPIAVSPRVNILDMLAVYPDKNSVDSTFQFKTYDDRDSAFIDSINIVPKRMVYLQPINHLRSNYFYFELINSDSAGVQINRLDAWLSDGGIGKIGD